MNYKINKKINISIITLFFMLLGLVSCYDNGYEEFVPPTGNVNNIQPNTLFTTSAKAGDNLSVVFRSYSTDAASYLWDFGDGNTSTEANPDYTYTTGGIYNVKLTTTSSDGLIAIDSSDVAPIFVDFNFTMVDSEVNFNNLSSGVKELEWSFGDDESVSWVSEDTTQDENFSPVHVYKTVDTFDAVLTATNFLGVQFSVTKKIEGLVLSTVPDFTSDVNGLKVDFTDTSFLAVSYSWDFGDGSAVSTDKDPSHTYTEEKTYNVTLTTKNSAGVAKSVTKGIAVGAVKATKAAIVLNGTADDWTKNTSDNSDAWDMNPNSTIQDNSGATIDSPYRALWQNTALDSWLLNNCGNKNEQPGSSSDGTYVNGSKTRGLKLNSKGSCRRLYQVVEVEIGVAYTFTIDTRSEAEGVNTEIFILNTEIETEEGLDANATSVDAYYNITNDHNSSKGSATNNTFTTSTFIFKPSATKIVIYARATPPDPDNSDKREVFVDNIGIITPGF